MKKIILLLSSTFLLTACLSTAPNTLVVAPELTMPLPSVNFQPVNFSVVDLRPQQHIVQINQQDKAATLLSSQQLLSKVLNNTMHKAMQRQGFQLSASAPIKIELAIDKALIQVEQSLVKYQASNHIVVRMIINKGEQKLTKSFSSTGKSHGPLKADIAVLERDFNQQLATLLASTLTDSEIQAFLRG